VLIVMFLPYGIVGTYRARKLGWSEAWKQGWKKISGLFTTKTNK
ncbi:MAG: hypothetical protein ACD_34C00242G0001, partial [uncultured bacterium]